MHEAKKAGVLFVEMKPWERDFVKDREEVADWDARFAQGTAEQMAEGQRSPVEALSCFIRSRMDAVFLNQCANLKLIATRSTGFDHIDVKECRGRGITVCNVPRYGENTVAEHTFGLILSLSRNIPEAVDGVKRGKASIDRLQGFDLYGKTLGVIGAGSIGLHVIRIGRAMSMRVLAYDVQAQPLLAEVLGFEYVGLDTLLREADVVSIHAPLLESTYHLLHAEKLALMKPSAILVNTARGPIVDSKALLMALNEGRLAGAALDVLEGEEVITEDRMLLLEEPVQLEKLRLAVEAYQLMHHPRVIVTPHIGFYSHEALERILLTTVQNISAFLAGCPQNAVAAPGG